MKVWQIIELRYRYYQTDLITNMCFGLKCISVNFLPALNTSLPNKKTLVSEYVSTAHDTNVCRFR